MELKACTILYLFEIHKSLPYNFYDYLSFDGIKNFVTFIVHIKTFHGNEVKQHIKHKATMMLDSYTVIMLIKSNTSQCQNLEDFDQVTHIEDIKHNLNYICF